MRAVSYTHLDVYKRQARLCLWLAVGTVGCVLLECLCQNIADRLQAAAGYMVFADLRMELGRHLRRLPMGYFTAVSYTHL